MKINAIRSCMMKLTSCCIFVVTTCALTTVTQAQNKTLQYLRNTPASLYDVGMMRLEAKLNDLKKYSHLGYPELMSLPTFIYARETDEFRFVILESGYEEIDTVRQDCKKAIIAIKNLGGVDEEGKYKYEAKFSQYVHAFLPDYSDDWPQNYRQFGANLDKKFLIICSGFTTETENITLKSELISSQIYEELD